MKKHIRIIGIVMMEILFLTYWHLNRKRNFWQTVFLAQIIRWNGSPTALRTGDIMLL